MQHLSADAEAVVKLANEIARADDLEYVGTEHILLAALEHDANRGAAVLKALGVDTQRTRQAVRDIVRHDKEDTWVFGRLPGSPHFKNVMALAIESAKQLGAEQIGSEHLVLALLREKESTAERAMRQLGLTVKALRDEIAKQADVA